MKVKFSLIVGKSIVSLTELSDVLLDRLEEKVVALKEERRKAKLNAKNPNQYDLFESEHIGSVEEKEEQHG